LPTQTLENIRVLIVEDELFVALDLVEAVESAGGIAVGPAANVSAALRLLDADGIEAAILDVNLPDGHIGPVLEALKTSAVVVHTGVGLPQELSARFPHVLVYSKPTSPEILTTALARQLFRPR
jgi:DNA-binding response OmpR family regulator